MSNFTQAQLDKMHEALNQYLSDSRKEAERIIKQEYMTGKGTVLDSVFGKSSASYFLTDPEQVFVKGLVRDNINLISNLGGKYLNEVESLSKLALEGHISPVDLETMFNKAGLRFESSAQVVAFDQIAKAQEEGRNYEYRELGVESVDVMVAPDACEICKPYDGTKQPVNGGDRPQYHIQCLCFDIPSRDDVNKIKSQDNKELTQDTFKGLKGREDLLSKDYKDFKSALTNEELSALKEYQGTAYDSINAALRGGEQNISYVPEIDSAIAKSPGMSQDMVLFRGVAGDTEQLNRMIGTEFIDNAFCSTSIERGVAESRGAYIMEIHCSADTKGIWYNSLSKSVNKEKEFLLNRGLKFVVKDVVQGRLPTLIVEVL